MQNDNSRPSWLDPNFSMHDIETAKQKQAEAYAEMKKWGQSRDAELQKIKADYERAKLVQDQLEQQAKDYKAELEKVREEQLLRATAPAQGGYDPMADLDPAKQMERARQIAREEFEAIKERERQEALKERQSNDIYKLKEKIGVDEYRKRDIRLKQIVDENNLWGAANVASIANMIYEQEQASAAKAREAEAEKLEKEKAAGVGETGGAASGSAGNPDAKYEGKTAAEVMAELLAQKER